MRLPFFIKEFWHSNGGMLRLFYFLSKVREKQIFTIFQQLFFWEKIRKFFTRLEKIDEWKSVVKLFSALMRIEG